MVGAFVPCDVGGYRSTPVCGGGDRWVGQGAGMGPRARFGWWLLPVSATARCGLSWPPSRGCCPGWPGTAGTAAAVGAGLLLVVVLGGRVAGGLVAGDLSHRGLISLSAL